ncbi:membrane protein [Candidatus Magnetobacterium bavaricum]|uniref:Membrane protein n=1 Tax=Candidatus Magnetobacterium bavaricum TaxID=29290 RepID=A0A0F3GPR6_9BACT|nr:membrane protein [Candidatus Magnetobacterium bavaricum]
MQGGLKGGRGRPLLCLFFLVVNYYLLSCSRLQGLLFWGDFYVASTKISKYQRTGIHQFPQRCLDFVFFYPLVGRYLFEYVGLFEFFLTG